VLIALPLRVPRRTRCAVGTTAQRQKAGRQKAFHHKGTKITQRVTKKTQESSEGREQKGNKEDQDEELPKLSRSFFVPFLSFLFCLLNSCLVFSLWPFV
jgi:hypothetical protein